MRERLWILLIFATACTGTFVPFAAWTDKRDMDLSRDRVRYSGEMEGAATLGLIYVPESLFPRVRPSPVDGWVDPTTKSPAPAARTVAASPEGAAGGGGETSGDDALSGSPGGGGALDLALNRLPEDPSDWWYALPLALAFAIGWWAWKGFQPFWKSSNPEK